MPMKERTRERAREMIKRFFGNWLGACGDVTRAGGATLPVCCHVNQKRAGNLMKRWKGIRRKKKSIHRTSNVSSYFIREDADVL